VRAKAILLFALLAATGSARGACLANAPSLSFGPYDGVSGSPATTSAAITVTCDQSPAATATISIGPSGVSGGFFPRRMRQDGGSDTLDYNFYADPGGASVWGDGTGGTVTRSQRVLKSKPWTVTVFGRIPAGQDVTAGSYSDILTITIDF
jgi:spore coat protein U-like protein